MVHEGHGHRARRLPGLQYKDRDRNGVCSGPAGPRKRGGVGRAHRHRGAHGQPQNRVRPGVFFFMGGHDPPRHISGQGARHGRNRPVPACKHSMKGVKKWQQSALFSHYRPGIDRRPRSKSRRA